MLKTYIHQNKGTCSTQVSITYDDETHIIHDINFKYGCNGNTKGVSKLCVNRKLEDVYNVLNGIDCRNRGTSCPNELAKGIKDILENKN